MDVSMGSASDPIDLSRTLNFAPINFKIYDKGTLTTPIDSSRTLTFAPLNFKIYSKAL